MLLTPLYHWSPADRFDSIRDRGLMTNQEATVASTPLTYLCFGTTPQLAWRISGAMDWVSEIVHWDLWLAHIAETDEVTVRGNYGPQLEEVNIRGHIPPDRLWWCGRRDVTGHPSFLGPVATT
jgi:hypothetical protein